MIIVAKDNGTLLRENIFEQILLMDEIVRNITIHHKEDGKDYSYQDLCAMTDGWNCWYNSILDISIRMFDIESGNYTLTYPVNYDFDPYNYEAYEVAFPGSIGGITLDEKGKETGIGTLYGFQAVNLNYFLDSTTTEDVIRYA